MKIGLLCGGPSLERGISLNSARSVLDHLEDENIEICPIYFDSKKQPYAITKSQLYSNTPSDFDFKLKQTAQPLSKVQLVNFLKEMNIVFPVIHGAYGEDGEIQNFLEQNKIPYIGSDSISCKKAFDKYSANQLIRSLDFFSLPSAVLKIYHKDHKELIEKFFKNYNINRAAVKPASGGSSIGVFSVTDPKEALEKTELLFSKRMDTRVVIEEFATGSEFTVIILQNRFGLPVAILPTEIETDYTENQIFDYRRKYLPTRQVIYHCPPRFSDDLIEKIQLQAEQLFSALGMRDFARFDGWFLPDGNIWFSDFNPISGMEQNSFLFQQSSRIGLTHQGVLRYILRHACERYSIKFPQKFIEKKAKVRKSVNILFGGRTSERQVSLMSGTNVWLKLRKSKYYKPNPFLLDANYNVWELPYSLTLNHTVEEIFENCQHAKADQERLKNFEQKARLKLALNNQDDTEPFFQPTSTSLKEFIKKSPFVFIALHGGIGENGTIQQELSTEKVLFNGANAEVSKLCINKSATSLMINSLNIKRLASAPHKLVNIKDLPKTENTIKLFWKNLCKELGSKSVIVKPKSDGCSSGIVHLFSAIELQKYIDIIKFRLSSIPSNTFHNQAEIIELPLDPIDELLFERFIETDSIRINGNNLHHKLKSGWVEITVGVLEENGKLKSLNPSITVAEGEVLSVEEKFQGGTGVNITPPPESIIKTRILLKIKNSIQLLSKKIGIKGYARVDAFANIKTGELIIIEINTLPGLTPSTVIYQQALAQNPEIYPKHFLELLIKSAGY